METAFASEGSGIHATWLDRLRRLNPNISRRHGNGAERFAPHKPLLLLCIVDLAERMELSAGKLAKTPELRLRFDSYWSIVQPRWGGKPGLDLPFHYLATQGFWRTFDLAGNPSSSADMTVSIQLEPGFLECLQNRLFRMEARLTLIRTWFPESEGVALLAATGISRAEARKHAFRLKEEAPEYVIKGRDARFRITVVTQYRFTCALTGYGVHTSKGATLVEAAHIRPFAESRNDNADNGLALSRDAHWMFDEHLWSVDEKFRVMVAREIFTEWGPEAQWLKKRNGQQLFFMDGVHLRPSRENLLRHFQAFVAKEY